MKVSAKYLIDTLGPFLVQKGKTNVLQGHIIPGEDSTYNIGSPDKHWLDGYFDNIWVRIKTSTPLLTSYDSISEDVEASPTGNFIFGPSGKYVNPDAAVDIIMGSHAKKYKYASAAYGYYGMITPIGVQSVIPGALRMGAVTTYTTRDMARDETTLYVNDNTLSNGDFIVVLFLDNSAPPVSVREFMKINSTATLEAEGDYSYTVVRDLSSEAGASGQNPSSNSFDAFMGNFMPGTIQSPFIPLALEVSSGGKIHAGEGIIVLGNAVDDGFIEWSQEILDGQAGPGISTYRRTATTTYDSYKRTFYTGRLNGLADYIASGIGTGIGNDLSLDPSSATDGYIGIWSDKNTLRINNPTIRSFSAGAEKGYWGPDGAFRLGVDISADATTTLKYDAASGNLTIGTLGSDDYMVWNHSAQELYGRILLVGGSRVQYLEFSDYLAASVPNASANAQRMFWDEVAGALYIKDDVGNLQALNTSEGVTDHGLLTGLGDDDHLQYHTNARGDARYSLLTHDHDSDYAALVHAHDDRYFTESEHINASIGASDAGKPIVLDAAGILDSSMIPSAALGDLSDVILASPADDDKLYYNATAGEWQNSDSIEGILKVTNTQATISSGVATTEDTHCVLTSESGTADDLDTLNPASGVRRLVCLQAATGHTITVKHGTGNISTASGSDVVLSTVYDQIWLWKRYAASNWAEMPSDHGDYAALVHTHDDRYFTEAEYINSSTGESDAGKPIVLGAAGILDSSMIPSIALNDLSDVVSEGSPDTNNIIVYNGTNWNRAAGRRSNFRDVVTVTINSQGVIDLSPYPSNAVFYVVGENYQDDTIEEVLGTNWGDIIVLMSMDTSTYGKITFYPQAVTEWGGANFDYNAEPLTGLGWSPSQVAIFVNIRNVLYPFNRNEFQTLSVKDLSVWGDTVAGDVKADSVRSWSSLMNDDSVQAIKAPSSAGSFLLYCTYAPQTGARRNSTALIPYNTATGEQWVLWQPSTEVDVSTAGKLFGQTGPDGTTNISAHTDGYIYVENRQGFMIGQGILFLG